MVELAIIGAGPAGMAAAVAAREAGMSVLLLDDREEAGGQILRRPPRAFSVSRWLPQRAYGPLHALYARFTAGRDTSGHERNAAVLGIEPLDEGFELQVLTPAGLVTRRALRVLVATGCYDMPLAFPGSLLPGVMATGGLQAFLKSQQILPGERFLFVGSHPLQLIVASQIARAGGEVAAVVFSQPFPDFLALLRRPVVLARQWPNMLLILGVFLDLLARRVPLRFGRELLSANGDERLESVTLRRTDGREAEHIACDRLGTCYSFLSNSDLLRQAGARCRWSQSKGGWIAEHDDAMRASLAGLYVAGESTGVGGARVACLEGRLAALSAARDAGRLQPSTCADACAKLQKSLAAARAFADLLAAFSYPGDALLARAMEDDAYLCKCEEVTVGSVRATLAANADLSDLSALKLLTRCGMGHCQGRYCHFQSRFLLARERGADPATLGAFTARFPNRPVAVSALAAAAEHGGDSC